MSRYRWRFHGQSFVYEPTKKTKTHQKPKKKKNRKKKRKNNVCYYYYYYNKYNSTDGRVERQQTLRRTDWGPSGVAVVAV